MNPIHYRGETRVQGIKKSIQGFTALSRRTSMITWGLMIVSKLLAIFQLPCKFNRLVFSMSKALHSLSAQLRPDHLSSQTAFHILSAIIFWVTRLFSNTPSSFLPAGLAFCFLLPPHLTSFFVPLKS